ncbi:tRNA (adenosine(37)-N6)-dimethylallyltransferase MiaA [soil metagenome]
MPDRKLIAVMGTTASGKTELAESLADQRNAQLINADAFQVYRHMDIGTAKSPRKAEYELIDIRDPNESFGVGEWIRNAYEVLTNTTQDVVVVGGTGLYIRALFEEYDDLASAPDPDLRLELNQIPHEDLLNQLKERNPAAYEKVDQKNRVRVQRAVERSYSSQKLTVPDLSQFVKVKFWLDRDSEDVQERIETRAQQMVDEGWINEVETIRNLGYKIDDPGLRAHGYRHIWQVVEGTMNIDEALSLTTMEVKRYAKRQRTWLRKEPGLIRIEPNESAHDALTAHLK